MKVLLIAPGPAFAVADVYEKLYKGLVANGCDVVKLPFNDYIDFFAGAHLDRGEGLKLAVTMQEACAMAADAAIDSCCYQFEPDVVISVSSFFVPQKKYELLRRKGHHVVLWFTESPYEDDKQAWTAGFADTVIVNDPTNLEMFRAVNKNSHYIPHCYDPDIHHPGPSDPEFESDFFFVGTGYPSRVKFFNDIDWSGIEFKLGGNWNIARGTPLEKYVVHPIEWCLENVEAQQFYWSTQISANVYRREATADEYIEGWAVGPREIELAATQTFFLREARGESDELFPMMPTFTEPADFEEKLRWWLPRVDERREASIKAAAAVADRTAQQTAAALLRLIP